MQWKHSNDCKTSQPNVWTLKYTKKKLKRRWKTLKNVEMITKESKWKATDRDSMFQRRGKKRRKKMKKKKWIALSWNVNVMLSKRHTSNKTNFSEEKFQYVFLFYFILLSFISYFFASFILYSISLYRIVLNFGVVLFLFFVYHFYTHTSFVSYFPSFVVNAE